MNEQVIEGTPTAAKRFVKNFALMNLVDENEKSVLIHSKSQSKPKIIH